MNKLSITKKCLNILIDLQILLDRSNSELLHNWALHMRMDQGDMRMALISRYLIRVRTKVVHITDIFSIRVSVWPPLPGSSWCLIRVWTAPIRVWAEHCFSPLVWCYVYQPRWRLGVICIWTPPYAYGQMVLIFLFFSLLFMCFSPNLLWSFIFSFLGPVNTWKLTQRVKYPWNTQTSTKYDYDWKCLQTDLN